MAVLPTLHRWRGWPSGISPRVGGIQVSDYADRAGSSNVTLVVSSLDEQLAALEAEGISVSPIQGTPGFVKAATVTDPEGNEITFAEDLTDRT